MGDYLGAINKLHQAMASAGSVYSGSPESKSTLDTPENGPYDSFFSLTTPSDLRLSLSDDSYAEWKALPSRLLESPPPQISTIQFHSHPGKLAGGSKPRNGNDLFDVDESLHPSAADVTTGSLVQGIESSIGRDSSECSNTDRKSLNSPQGLNDQSLKYIPQDWNLEPTEWSNISTRHLKICDIAPTTSLVIIYELLQVEPPFLCGKLRKCLSNSKITVQFRNLGISKSFTLKNFFQMVFASSPFSMYGMPLLLI